MTGAVPALPVSLLPEDAPTPPVLDTEPASVPEVPAALATNPELPLTPIVPRRGSGSDSLPQLALVTAITSIAMRLNVDVLMDT
jgi:hypothetical protein